MEPSCASRNNSSFQLVARATSAVDSGRGLQHAASSLACHTIASLTATLHAALMPRKRTIRMNFGRTSCTSILLGCAFASQLVLARAPEMAPAHEHATRVHVDKSDRVLTLFRNDTPIARYRVRLGANPRGHKQAKGDERTPEGAYVLDHKNAKSRFNLSIHVSYPNASDQAAARAAGRDPGGQIMVHGGNQWWRPWNWTDGCIAVTNREIEEIWRLVPVGTPIQIDP